MMPPIKGMQASAAATFEGKPVDVDFGPSSGPGLDGGGCGVGSGSGMIYIQRMQNLLSSNLAFAPLFSLSLAPDPQYDVQLTPIAMSKSSPPPVRYAFTLVELLVVIATIGILLGIAVPALNSAYERAKVTKDLSNLRQIGLGMQLYLNDKDGFLPAIDAAPGIGTNATPVICPKYIATKKVFQSSFDKRAASETDNAPVSYGINANMYTASPGIAGNTARVVSPSSTIFMAPNYNGNPGVVASWTGVAAVAPFVPNLAPGGGPGMTTGPQRNGLQINVLFCDLHAETMAFGPAGTAGTFQDITSDPLGLKHWDPTR
jgi:prepilin-type N-terminal cleavage/methylation domain-containing protein/prepilin-type processing-associated H-X9-DG protein